MPRRERFKLTEQRCFFVTTTTKNKYPLFHSEELLQGLLDIIIFNITRNNSILFGYVLMINHFHLIVYVNDGGKVLSKIMHDIKSYSARTLFPKQGSIWMERFDDVSIYTEKQFRVKLKIVSFQLILKAVRRGRLTAHKSVTQ